MNKYLKEDQFMLESTMIFHNSMNIEKIRSAVTPYGYNDSKMGECADLLEKTEALMREKHVHIGLVAESSQAFSAALKELMAIHRRHRKAAKIVFEFQPDAVMKLGLTGKLSQLYLPFMASAELFYERLSSDTELRDQLSQMNISGEIVQQFKARIFYVKELKRNHLHCQAESEKITLQKNGTLKSLRKWIARYTKVVEIAASESGSDEILLLLGMR